MTQTYTDNPFNMADIMQYIITDKTQYAQEIFTAEKCFIYDTCAFRKHVRLEQPEILFEFIKKKNGIVMITRTIIMELASANKSLNMEYIEYLEKMHRAGIRVLVIYEEELFDILNQCFTSRGRVNEFLGTAIKVVKSTAGTISKVYNSEKQLREEIMTRHNTDSTLFARFFEEVRKNKESGDNLGEEMIAVCIHMLSNIPDIQNYKYIVLTEDKGAIGLMNKTQKNIWRHLEKKAGTAATTIALGQKLYQEKLIETKEELEHIISAGNPEELVKILASEEYDLEPREKTMSCRELTDKIVTPNAIHIYY